MLDALELEQRGIPSVPVGVELLIRSTGEAMARAQGYPDYPMASFPHFSGALGTIRDEGPLGTIAADVADQVGALLVRR